MFNAVITKKLKRNILYKKKQNKYPKFTSMRIMCFGVQYKHENAAG